ncbi:MAG: LysE family translocator [Pseudomonadota bacterium]
MLSYEFLIAAMIVVLIPGTGVVYTLATGMTRGAHASMAAAFGCTLGIIPAIAAAFLGLSALLHAGALAYTVLKYVGAAYLLYLAWQIWRDKGPISFSREVPVSMRQIVRTGFLINVLNPKLSVFFMAFLPQFIDPSGAVNVQMASMSAAFMVMTFAVFVVYGAAASALSSVLRRPGVANGIRYAAAAAFAGFGARLALADNR